MPRVLVDATAVPEDRGGVGRYVDQLLPALAELGTDLAVVCQSRDEAYYRELLPGVRVEAEGAGSVVVEVLDGAAPTHVARAVLATGASLDALVPERRTLEEAFLEATEATEDSA